MGQKENPLEVNVEQGVELLLAGLLDAGVNADAGVVDQKIEPIPLPRAQLLAHLAGESGKAAAVGHIEGQGMGPDAEGGRLGHHGRRFIGLTAIGDDEVDAFGREGQCRLFAKAAAGAGDECDGMGHERTPVCGS